MFPCKFPSDVGHNYGCHSALGSCVLQLQLAFLITSMNEGTGHAVVRTDPLRSFCDNLSCQEMSISLCTQMKYEDRPLVHLYQAFRDQVR